METSREWIDCLRFLYKTASVR